MKNRMLEIGAVAVAMCTVLGLSACNKTENSPQPVPTVAPGPEVTSTIEPEPQETTSEPRPEPTETQGTAETENPEPVPSPTASDPGTPGTAFAQRWGQKYPQIPEYAILKAANRVCDALAVAGPDWNNPLTVKLLEEAVSAFGIADNDAVEFTQDAQQNYCGSTSNPT